VIPVNVLTLPCAEILLSADFVIGAFLGCEPVCEFWPTQIIPIEKLATEPSSLPRKRVVFFAQIFAHIPSGFAFIDIFTHSRSWSQFSASDGLDGHSGGDEFGAAGYRGAHGPTM
jgi:hypothetical protein